MSAACTKMSVGGWGREASQEMCPTCFVCNLTHLHLRSLGSVIRMTL